MDAIQRNLKRSSSERDGNRAPYYEVLRRALSSSLRQNCSVEARTREVSFILQPQMSTEYLSSS